MLALRQHSWTLAAPCGSPTLWCLSGAQRLSYGFWDVCLRPIPAATGGALYGSGWRWYGAADRGCDVLLLRPRRGAAAWAPRERPPLSKRKHQSRLGSGIRRGRATSCSHQMRLRCLPAPRFHRRPRWRHSGKSRNATTTSSGPPGGAPDFHFFAKGGSVSHTSLDVWESPESHDNHPAPSRSTGLCDSDRRLRVGDAVS